MVILNSLILVFVLASDGRTILIFTRYLLLKVNTFLKKTNNLGHKSTYPGQFKPKEINQPQKLSQKRGIFVGRNAKLYCTRSTSGKSLFWQHDFTENKKGMRTTRRRLYKIMWLVVSGCNTVWNGPWVCALSCDDPATNSRKNLSGEFKIVS